MPEELCPVRTVGVLTLDRNPTNYFAETEQIAFHPGHLVPGIGFVDDPLLHARLFSYLDTQLTRLGGPNFNQIPINRPIAPVNDNNRDGFSQQAVHDGVAAYTPNSLGGGCPFAHAGDGAYTHEPREVAGPKIKRRPSSFDDHFTQATLFHRSLTPTEQEHIAGAFSFELAKCVSGGIHARMVANLAQVDTGLAEQVAAHLGIDVPDGSPVEPAPPTRPSPSSSKRPTATTRRWPSRTRPGSRPSVWMAVRPVSNRSLTASSSHSPCTVTGPARDRCCRAVRRGPPGRIAVTATVSCPPGRVVNAMDAITLLKKDHDTVEKLFKRFEATSDAALVERRTIVDKIIEELSQHAAIEEQIFYPVTRATVGDVDDEVLEGLEEHHIVKWLLDELEHMDASDERFKAKVTVLIENVRHHVEEEEGDYFPKVRSELGRNDLTDLGDAMEKAKETAPTHPHPRSPDTPPGNVVAGAAAGVVDRVADTVSGIAQGGVSVAQDLIARFTGRPKPRKAPTGSPAARKTATKIRTAASDATDKAATTGKATVRSASSGANNTVAAAKGTATSTGRTAKAGARTTATTGSNAATKAAKTAKTGAKRTATAAAKTSKRTAKTAKTGAKRTASTATGAAKKTAATAKRASN